MPPFHFDFIRGLHKMSRPLRTAKNTRGSNLQTHTGLSSCKCPGEKNPQQKVDGKQGKGLPFPFSRSSEAQPPCYLRLRKRLCRLPGGYSHGSTPQQDPVPSAVCFGEGSPLPEHNAASSAPDPGSGGPSPVPQQNSSEPPLPPAF